MESPKIYTKAITIAQTLLSEEMEAVIAEFFTQIKNSAHIIADEAAEAAVEVKDLTSAVTQQISNISHLAEKIVTAYLNGQQQSSASSGIEGQDGTRSPANASFEPIVARGVTMLTTELHKS